MICCRPCLRLLVAVSMGMLIGFQAPWVRSGVYARPIPPAVAHAANVVTLADLLRADARPVAAPPGLLEGEPGVLVEVCSPLTSAPVHVGETVIVNVELIVSWGSHPREAEVGLKLVLDDEPVQLALVWPSKRPSPHSHTRVQQEPWTELRVAARGKGVEKLSLGFRLKAMKTGSASVRCEAVVTGFTQPNMLLPRYPIKSKHEDLGLPIHVAEPYELEISDPRPPWLRHGEIARADLILHIRTEARGRVDHSRTRLNGVPPALTWIDGNPRPGQSRAITLIKDVASQYRGCPYSWQSTSPRSVMFDLSDFRFVLDLGSGLEYEYQMKDRAEAPRVRHVESFPFSPACAKEESFDDLTCRCHPTQVSESPSENPTLPSSPVDAAAPGLPNLLPVSEPEPHPEPEIEEFELSTVDPGSRAFENVGGDDLGSANTAIGPAYGAVSERQAEHRGIVVPRFVVPGQPMQILGKFDCTGGIIISVGETEAGLLECAQSRIEAQAPLSLRIGEDAPIEVRDSRGSLHGARTARVIGVRSDLLGRRVPGRRSILRFTLTGTTDSLWVAVEPTDPEGCSGSGGWPLLARSSGGLGNSFEIVCERILSDQPEFRLRLLHRNQ